MKRTGEMRQGLSHRIVGFLAGLFPMYEHVHVDGHSIAARSLVDGTLIVPVCEEEDNENGFVLVNWQGDSNRSAEVRGEFLASIAVVKYIELHAAATDKRTRSEYEHLAQHFTHKTGGSLVLETEDGGAEAFALLGRLIEKSGTAVAIGLLKKAIGL